MKLFSADVKIFLNFFDFFPLKKLKNHPRKVASKSEKNINFGLKTANSAKNNRAELLILN